MDEVTQYHMMATPKLIHKQWNLNDSINSVCVLMELGILSQEKFEEYVCEPCYFMSRVNNR